MPPKGRGGRGAGARRGTRKKATPAAKQPSDTSSLSSQEEEEEEQQPVRHKITLKGPMKKTSSQGSSTTTSGKAGKGSKAKEKGNKGKGKAVVQPPLQVESEDESVGQSDGGTASQPAEKKQRKFHAPLTDDEEEQMIDWLRDHPELYNRKLKSYKDIRAKEAHWMDIAAILGRDVHYLKTWYQSIRTRFGRLRKKKSGDGAADPTDRDAWILRCLDFLAPHIVEVRSRAAVSVSKHYFHYKSRIFFNILH